MSTASRAKTEPFERVDLFGVQFDRLSEAECVRHVMNELQAGRGGWIVTPNLDILRLLLRSAALLELFEEADLFVADGMPIIWLSRLLGDPLPERVAGSSLVSTLSAAAADHGRSIYLIGGNPGAAEGAAATLVGRHPSLRIVGADCPDFGFEQLACERTRVVEDVARAGPDVVFVALGCPKQEWLIREIRTRVPTAWFLGVGISLSYLSGDVHRAPAWMRRVGLEWLFRLAQEPGRLTRRYLVDDLPFLVRLVGRSLRRRGSRSGAASRIPA